MLDELTQSEDFLTVPVTYPEEYTPLDGNPQFLEDLIRSNDLDLGFINTLFDDWPAIHAIIMEKWEAGDLYVEHFERVGNGGAYSTGKAYNCRLEQVLRETEPFKTLLESLDEYFDIVSGWMLANECGEHDLHQDGSFGDATHRLIISGGCVGKTFKIVKK